MKCPSCHYEETKVTDSRAAADDMAVRRRRECLKCKQRFSTYEQIELLELAVVKKDGRHEPYNKAKLVGGIRKALEKRPVSEDDIAKLASHIEGEIQKQGKSDVPSVVIGDIVMKHLKAFDKIAYIRFASVYKDFQDVESFQEELRAFLTKKKP